MGPERKPAPLFYTLHIGDKWVNVTTLPALYLAYPMFKVFGYQGALIVPMAGSLLAALAARALARRLRPEDERSGWLAFWLVGLASPIAVYALDFWEHSLGVGLIAWAVVLLYDVTEGKAGWRAALAGGLLFGAAATMRTEALVYAAVATAVTCVVLLVRRRTPFMPIVVGLAVVAGLAVRSWRTTPWSGRPSATVCEPGGPRAPCRARARSTARVPARPCSRRQPWTGPWSCRPTSSVAALSP